MIRNRINALLPNIGVHEYSTIQNRIGELKNGSLSDYIIAQAASILLSEIKILENYQKSPEWQKFYWGNRVVRLEGKLYYIGELRYKETDFKDYPFFAYEIVGKRKFRLKKKRSYIDNSDERTCDARITWHGVTIMQRENIHFKIKNYLEISHG